MNSQSNTMPEAAMRTQAIAPALIPESRVLLWSLRRELWENRSIYLAPLAAAGLILFGFLISTGAGRWEKALRLDPTRLGAKVAEPYEFAALLIMLTTFLVGVFYCLDALYGERRDRSILFWKSMPVSDATAVISKAAIPLVVLPLLTFGITVATQTIMLLISSAVVAASGLNVSMLWAHLPLLQMWLMLLYHLVTVHALWYAPIYGWLLFVSAWARRLPILWASLPLLALGIFEKIAFNTTHFASMLSHRMGGGTEAIPAPGTTPMDPMTHLTPGQFLSSPGLWVGLTLTALFLAAAVRLRRDRGPV